MTRLTDRIVGIAAPNGRGLGVLAGGAVLLVAGRRFGYPDLALLGAAAGVALACGWAVASWRPRLGVVRVAEPDRVARGEPASMSLTVRNTSRARRASLVAADRCGPDAVPVPLPRLRPGRQITVRYPVPTRRRGVVPVGPLRVTRGDPLGLVSLSRSYGDSASVWVHPRIHPLRAMPAGLARSLDGRVDRVPQGAITFDSLREYVVGDELRRVHWRSSAKVGELMVREQLDTSEPSIVVLLDDRAAAYPDLRDGAAETFESACEAAASIVAAGLREDLPVRLRLVAGPAEGPYLDVLTRAEPRGAGPSLGLAVRQLRQQRLGDTLVYLTGPGARTGLGEVSALRGAYPTVVLARFGATDAPPVAGGGGVVFVDAADGAQFAAAWDGIRGW